jgi:peptidoglycan/xylan/chitin deacetylase (PgdA/CDA1 family)
MTDHRWPKGEPFALCLTHDVDRIHKYAYHYFYYGLFKGTRRLPRQFKALRQRLSGREPYWNFERIMNLEDRLGVRSTFLFLNECTRGFRPIYWGRYSIQQQEIKSIIRELDAGGWEIGLHGSLFSYKDINLLSNEKGMLEDIVGKKVRSSRQHCLKYLPGKTFELQEKIGLEVDSTFGYSNRLWNLDDGVLPFFPNRSGILELPISVMDTVELEKPDMKKEIWSLFNSIFNTGGLMVLDWHQCKFNPEENPHHVELYESLLQEALSRGAWVATMGEVACHWKKDLK